MEMQSQIIKRVALHFCLEKHLLLRGEDRRKSKPRCDFYKPWFHYESIPLLGDVIPDGGVFDDFGTVVIPFVVKEHTIRSDIFLIKLTILEDLIFDLGDGFLHLYFEKHWLCYDDLVEFLNLEQPPENFYV